MSPPTSLPEVKPPRRHRTLPPRSREEAYKRWLAVLFSVVTLLVALTTFLQNDAGARSAVLTRTAQQRAIASTSTRTLGQQQTSYDYYVVARQYDELRAAANRYSLNSQPVEAGAYISASQQITPLSPLLSPAYSPSLPESNGWPGFARYESDTWVVTSTLLAQQREALVNEATGWDSKSNNYVASIAIFAVVLFLFGLAATLGGVVRWMFVVVGLLLTGITSVGVFVTLLLPVHHAPDAALQAYARGMGLVWQGRYSDATQQFDEAVRQDPNYASAYSQRGFANLRLHPPNLQGAVNDFQSALSKGADTYDVDWDLGWAAYLAGDTPVAVDFSRKALAANAKVCGPEFNIALALLAGNSLTQAQSEYEAAITRCASILTGALKLGAEPPASLFIDMQGAADDLDNLMCQLNQTHCYAGRDQPSTRNVRDVTATVALAEKMRKRIKEALTALEYQHTTVVVPTGATMEPLRFANRVDDEQGRYKSYVVRDVFADDGQFIDAIWSYTGMKSSINTVFKVFRDGVEEPGLRYAYDWALAENSVAEKQISGRLTLQPGEYRVEIYGNGELLTEGTFTLSAATRLPAPPAKTLRPLAPLSVGSLLLADDFVDNTHGWWTGTIDRTRVSVPAGGELNVNLSTSGDYWRLLCQDCGRFDNFYYETTARYVSGPDTWGYGLVARSDLATSNLYLFLISADGSFRVDAINADKLNTFIAWTSNSAINVNGSNRLGIAARGSSLQFYVNGKQIYQITDSAMATGYVGVAIEHDALNIAFSDLRVWQLR